MDLPLHLSLYLDGLLILPFRLPGDPVAGFWLGAGLLALACALLGEYSMALAYLCNRDHYRTQTREMTRMHNLSIRAIQAKDKSGYLAANRLANEHFGKAFFARSGLFATSLWPAPLALTWMSTRFAGLDIPFPGVGLSLGFSGAFILLYVSARMITAKAGRLLPFVRRARSLARSENQDQEVLSWSDLMLPSPGPEERGAV